MSTTDLTMTAKKPKKLNNRTISPKSINALSPRSRKSQKAMKAKSTDKLPFSREKIPKENDSKSKKEVKNIATAQRKTIKPKRKRTKTITEPPKESLPVVEKEPKENKGKENKGKEIMKSELCSYYSLEVVEAPNQLLDLPEEILLHILSFLPHFPDLLRLSTVSSGFHKLVTCGQLWQTVHLGNYEAIATDTLLVWIIALNSHVEVLSLKGCTEVTDVGLTAALGRCSSLKELYLEDLERQFSVQALLMIGKLCPRLETLVLPGILEQPDEVILPIISCCPNLSVFKSFSQFSNSTFKCLQASCSKLQKLRFGTTTKSTTLSQEAIKHLIQLSHLQSLECGYFCLGDVNWGHRKLSLVSFKAFGWLDMTPNAVRSLLQSCPKLESLHLVHSGGDDVSKIQSDWDTFEFLDVSKFCRGLRDINLCDTPFREENIKALVKQCTSLRELRIGMKGNPGTRYEIKDSWIYEVINFCPKIEVLKVYHAEIRPDTVCMLTRGCKHLRVVTLGKCKPITKLNSQLEALTTLQKLSLRNTITNDSVLMMLMGAFPCLQTVTLIETGVSDAIIGYILGRFRLRSLKLQPRARLTSEGEIVYKGNAARSRFAKKLALSDQEKVFLSLLKAETEIQTKMNHRKN